MVPQALRLFLVATAVALSASSLSAQPEPPKPGPEMDVLKKQEGSWDATIKMTGMEKESKGTMTCKAECLGLWLGSSFEADFGGIAFQGRGLDSYDPRTKKYVGVWVDSWTTSPMHTEGSYDKDKSELTMIGEGVGVDGKMHKHKMVTKFVDKDSSGSRCRSWTERTAVDDHHLQA